LTASDFNPINYDKFMIEISYSSKKPGFSGILFFYLLTARESGLRRAL